MKIFILQSNVLFCTKFPEASAWLSERRSACVQMFDEVVSVDPESDRQLVEEMQNGSIEKALAAAQPFFKGSSAESCVFLDARYPFVAPHELCMMYNESEAGNVSVLRTATGQLAAMVLRASHSGATLFDLPEFRSIAVDSLFGWLLAQSVHEQWPLFYFNTAYIDYWLSKTAPCGGSDAPPTTDDFDFFFQRAIVHCESKNRRLLDVGCSYGRLFPIFEKAGFAIHGVDLSWDAVTHAKEHLKYPVVQGALECSGMPASSFGMVCAWAVFECAHQSKALHHLLGRLEEGGILLLSGKNDGYEEDDHLAMDAERGAAGKLFPNGFTDFSMLEQLVPEYGGTVVECWYEKYRGDISKGRVVSERPLHFYQWVIAVKKTGPTPDFPRDIRISSPHSKTFTRKGCLQKRIA